MELIRDSRSSHPNLCTRALAALLDVLQGQQPQGLQSEPAEVIGKYLSLLETVNINIIFAYSTENVFTIFFKI